MNLLDVQKVLDAMKIGVKNTCSDERFIVHTDKHFVISLFYKNGKYRKFHITGTKDNAEAEECGKILAEIQKNEKK